MFFHHNRALFRLLVRELNISLQIQIAPGPALSHFARSWDMCYALWDASDAGSTLPLVLAYRNRTADIPFTRQALHLRAKLSNLVQGLACRGL